MHFPPVFPASFTESCSFLYSSEDLPPPCAQVSVIQAFREYGWHLTERHTKILGRDLGNWAVPGRVFILIYFPVPFGPFGFKKYKQFVTFSRPSV